jgi:cytochrome c nitrite reductase small subunit
MTRGVILRVALGVIIGVAIGVGAYTFIYAKGGSYLTNDPGACANCHVMNEYYTGWLKSSHRSVAVCNDCHTPSGFFAKYSVKASNGFWHSFAFTTGRFTDPLRIKQHNLEIAEQACRDCHQEIVEAIGFPHARGGEQPCVRCHKGEGHPLR